jgi:hypothetical protein
VVYVSSPNRVWALDVEAGTWTDIAPAVDAATLPRTLEIGGAAGDALYGFGSSKSGRLFYEYREGSGWQPTYSVSVGGSTLRRDPRNGELYSFGLDGLWVFNAVDGWQAASESFSVNAIAFPADETGDLLIADRNRGLLRYRRGQPAWAITERLQPGEAREVVADSNDPDRFYLQLGECGRPYTTTTGGVDLH